LSQSIATGKAV